MIQSARGVGPLVKQAWISIACALLGAGCANDDPAPPATSAISSASPVESAPATPPPPAPAPPPPPRVVMLAGGDVCLARDIGQTLLKDPEHDFFTTVAPLLKGADLRFANLEGPLSEQKGETQSPWNALTFTGPPKGAEALARAGFDVVSTANNHAWDYRERGLTETLDNLDRAGVRHVGTGRDLQAAEAPLIIEKNGLRLGFLAVTDIWNMGSLRTHKGASFVARADKDLLAASVRALRASGKADVIVVSYHGGVEYTDLPLPRTREILRASIDAGADMVLGHHPHVLQGIAWHAGKPILYSLGNLLMRLSQPDKKPTGYLARITIDAGQAPAIEVCPLVMRGITPTRVVTLSDPKERAAQDQRFATHLTKISRGLGGGIEVGAPGPDGCAPVLPAAEGTGAAAPARK
jgi:poly-gamma-glutamate capsule biosynthesis protein CapA/YwtB (metallophosphatase superfamily)